MGSNSISTQRTYIRKQLTLSPLLSLLLPPAQTVSSQVDLPVEGKDASIITLAVTHPSSCSRVSSMSPEALKSGVASFLGCSSAADCSQMGKPEAAAAWTEEGEVKPLGILGADLTRTFKLSLTKATISSMNSYTWSGQQVNSDCE